MYSSFHAYLPEFPFDDITIKYLLNHTSGLPDYELFDEMIKEAPGKIITNSDLLPALKTKQHLRYFSVGEMWQYSNTNFCLLALILEKVYDHPFQENIEKNIFFPANMKHTFFQDNMNYQNDPNRTINYEYPFLFSLKREPADSIKHNRWRSINVSGLYGQGNIMTTVDDMKLFDSALYQGILLCNESLNIAFTPTKLSNGNTVIASGIFGKSSYGLGWFISEDTSLGKIVWHTGGIPGGLSIFIRNLTKKQLIIAFDNNFNLNLYQYGSNALKIVNGIPISAPKKSVIRYYYQELIHHGVDAAFTKLIELKNDTLPYYIDENELNELGLQLLYAAPFEDPVPKALVVLKINILLFPKSFNTYDSYGEALRHLGRKEEALFMYKKSIELNPNNKGGVLALKELEDQQ
ncbi:MAG: serine hydrolase [Saprospiraceae bacterium]